MNRLFRRRFTSTVTHFRQLHKPFRKSALDPQGISTFGDQDDSAQLNLQLQGLGIDEIPRIKGRNKIKVNIRDVKPLRYAITSKERATVYKRDFDQFSDFLLRSGQSVSENSEKTYIGNAKLLIGYALNIKGYQPPKNEHLFKVVFPSEEKDAAQTLFEYSHWLMKERNASPTYQKFILNTSIKMLAFLYPQNKSAKLLPVLEVVHKMLRDQNKLVHSVPKNSQIDRKWMPWDEYLEFVKLLKTQCSVFTKTGRKRPPKAIARSYQRYLICAILACVPDRQRTIRELQVGKNLIKTLEGNYAGHWVINHKACDYKTGKYFGDRSPLIIHKDVSSYLESYLLHWRKHMNPQHDYVFSRQDGKGPLTASSLHNIFTTAVYNLTGKCLNPHMVRDILITYVKGTNASQRQLEALANYMGHSLNMQRSSYDRRSMAQKVDPAIKLIAQLHDEYAAGAESQDSNSEN